MRKVKFTQDSFDEKLGAILSEFPILDVRPLSYSRADILFTPYGTHAGLASVSVLSDECIVRQESLQARSRPITNRTASHRSGRKRLRSATQVWGQFVSMQTTEKGCTWPVRSMLLHSLV
jgi:hypothetical protein